VSLIAGLENGLEWLNGLWNGLWYFCIQQIAPFSSVSTLSDLKRVSFVEGGLLPMHRTHIILKIIKYALDL